MSTINCWHRLLSMLSTMALPLGWVERLGGREGALHSNNCLTGRLVNSNLSLRSGTKRYENVAPSDFIFYTSFYRDLGILQITGRWVGCPACRMTVFLYVWFAFSGTNKCDIKHVILSLYKQSRLWLRRSVNAVSPYNSYRTFRFRKESLWL